MIAESLKADPQLSNREHTRRTGVSDKTVGTVRSDLEAGAEIPHLENRQAPDGKSYPSSQPRREPVVPEPAVPEQTEPVDEPQRAPYSHRWEYGYCAPTALILGHDRRSNGRWRRGTSSYLQIVNSDSGWRNRMNETGLVLDELGPAHLREVRDGAASLDAKYEQARRQKDERKQTSFTTS